MPSDQSQKVATEFKKKFYLAEFSTDWLTKKLTHYSLALSLTHSFTQARTHSPTPSDKHNSITTKAMGSIFALFDVTSSRDVPFCQMQQLQWLHHGFTKACLCSPLCSIPLSTAVYVGDDLWYALWFWRQTWASAVLAGALLTLLK